MLLKNNRLQSDKKNKRQSGKQMTIDKKKQRTLTNNFTCNLTSSSRILSSFQFFPACISWLSSAATRESNFSSSTLILNAKKVWLEEGTLPCVHFLYLPRIVGGLFNFICEMLQGS